MKQIQSELTFIGRPFADQLMDEQRTFTQSNLALEQDEVFQAFLAKQQLSQKRSSMLVFGPENFMYWYGVTLPGKVAAPQGLLRFVLPETMVALEEVPEQNIAAFSQPLNLILPAFLAKVRREGIQTYENPGDSLMPYFVQDLNLTIKKLTQKLYLEDQPA